MPVKVHPVRSCFNCGNFVQNEWKQKGQVHVVECMNENWTGTEIRNFTPHDLEKCWCPRWEPEEVN